MDFSENYGTECHLYRCRASTLRGQTSCQLYPDFIEK